MYAGWFRSRARWITRLIASRAPGFGSLTSL
jgi:hypothetical protein